MSLAIQIKETLEKRARLVKEAHDINDKVLAAKRSMTIEEDTNYKKVMDDVRSLKVEIDRLVELQKVDEELNREAPGTKRIDTPEGGAKGSGDWRSSDQYRKLFVRYVTGDNAAPAEMRHLSAGAMDKGGALIAPEQFVADLIKFVDDAVYIRQWATKHSLVEAKSLGAPSLDTDIADFDWTTELATGSADTSMAFGKRLLTPIPAAKNIKVSRSLLLNSSLGAERIVMEALGRKKAYTEENAYLNGSGANRPLGVFTANANGIPTSRDMSTDNTATAVTFDGLKNAKGMLKQQYRGKAKWIAHRDFETMVSKLKDGEGRYLWQDSVVAGEPDRLLSIPFVSSEFAPNTYTTGLYAAVLGDFSFYHIVDVLNLSIQRLDELYAATNEVGYIARFEGDAMPVLAEAFVRVKLG